MEMSQNALRCGNFTSSEIFALTASGKAAGSLGAPAKTYIEEKNFERRLGRSIDDESNARPLSWGSLVERAAFEVLGLEYTLCSADTIQHPTIDCWAGSPDGVKVVGGEKTVIDIKCPATLKSFCRLYECKTIEDVRENCKEGDKYFWQLISNAILTNAGFAELIVFMPYQSELRDIRELAGNYAGDNQYRFKWIFDAPDSELPHLLNGGYYNHLHIIRFEVSQADKDFLTERVKLAAQSLIPFHEVVNIDNLTY